MTNMAETGGTAPPTATYRAFTVEQRGIEYIPPDQRRGRPIDLALMWGGAVTNIVPVVFGGLLPLMGLSIAQCVAVVIIGSLSWAAVGLISCSGPDAGTTTFMISRAPFGTNGNRICGFFTWLIALGFEATFMILVVQAGIALAAKAGASQGDSTKVIAIIVVGLLIPVTAVYGHATLVKVLSYLSLPFIASYVVLAIIVLPKAQVLHHSGSLGTVFVGLSLVVAAAGFGFSPQAADYSRYMPATVSRRALFWATSLGGFIPTTLLLLLGVVIGTRLTYGVDAISGIPSLAPAWFAVPYLVVISIQIIASDGFALYSSGVTLQAIGLKAKRWQCVVIDTSVCVVVTFIAVFSHQFDTILTDFLLFTNVFVAPWATIFMLDWLLRRGKYDAASLQSTHGGLYWRQGGFRLPAIIALAGGMLAALGWINTAPFIGPISSRAGGSDLSWAIGMIVSGVLYFLLGARQVRAEAGQEMAGMSQPVPARNAGATVLGATDPAID